MDRDQENQWRGMIQLGCVAVFLRNQHWEKKVSGHYEFNFHRRCTGNAEKQKSRKAEKQKSRKAEKQKSRKAEKQKSRKAEKQKSRKEEKQKSRKAEKQKSRKAVLDSQFAVVSWILKTSDSLHGFSPIKTG